MLLVAAVAMFAFAATAAAASAHEYRVAGKAVEARVPIRASDTAHTAVLKATPLGVATQLECKHQSLSGGLLSGGKSEATIEYLNCAVVKPAKCTLSSAVATTKGLLLSAAETELSPKEGVKFAEITLTGSECSLKEKPFEVTGTQKCTTPEPESEKAEHSIECTVAGSNLKAGGKTATYEGTISGVHIVNGAGEPTGELYSAI